MSQSLARRPPATLETVHHILESLVGRYCQEEVLTAVRQIPARNAKFHPMPAWVTSALVAAYRAKGIGDLYSHQASTAELVRTGKNVVVVTPTASGKTLCYNLPVLNAVLENAILGPSTFSRPKRWPRINWLNCRIWRNGCTTVSECSLMTATLPAMHATRCSFCAASQLASTLRVNDRQHRVSINYGHFGPAA
jgi:hypothetical protein